jgi:hypothetical protein
MDSPSMVIVLSKAEMMPQVMKFLKKTVSGR